MDSNAELALFRLSAYHTPKACRRLLSATTFSKQYPDIEIKIYTKQLKIKGNPSKPEEFDINVVISPPCDLPTSACLWSKTINNLVVNFAKDIFNAKRSNHNLSGPKKELLCWHHRLGHIGFRTAQFSLRTGALAATQTMQGLHKRTANMPDQDVPHCAACQFGL